MPKLYKVIKKDKNLNLEYRCIIIKNYLILYTISENNKTIYIAYIYYGKSNYLFKL